MENISKESGLNLAVLEKDTLISTSIENENAFQEIPLNSSTTIETDSNDNLDKINKESNNDLGATDQKWQKSDSLNSNQRVDDIKAKMNLKRNLSISKLFSKSMNNSKYEAEMIAEFLSINRNSTSGLIMNDRPENIPQKSKEEVNRHAKLNKEMIQNIKKGLEFQLKKKLDDNLKKRKREDLKIELTKIWKDEILPNWSSLKESNKLAKIWWNGIPPSIRSIVWKISIGNDLSITQSFLDILINEAKKNIDDYDKGVLKDKSDTSSNEHSESVHTPKEVIFLVDADIERTYPVLKIFQKGGPYYPDLRSLLVAYCCFRKDIGYVQGMSFLMGAILLNMNANDTFIVFTNLMNRPLQLGLFTLRTDLLECLYAQFNVLLEMHLPIIASHLRTQDVKPNVYLIEWLFTMYTRTLPLDISIRIMDIYFRDKEEFLFRTALGLLKYYEKEILMMDGFTINTFLASHKVAIDEELLFKKIMTIPQSIKWCEELQKMQLKLLGIS